MVNRTRGGLRLARSLRLFWLWNSEIVCAPLSLATEGYRLAAQRLDRGSSPSLDTPLQRVREKTQGLLMTATENNCRRYPLSSRSQTGQRHAAIAGYSFCLIPDGHRNRRAGV
jgi:hypothetical protein